MDQLKKYLAGETVIKRFLRETGQTIDWLLDNVRIEPNEGDPLTWPVSWPAEDLPPCHISILQEAALLVWFYQDKGTDEQRDRVSNRLTIASMGLDYRQGLEYRGAQKKKRAKRQTWPSGTKQELNARDQQIIEDYKKAKAKNPRVKPGGFASQHCEKYGLKPTWTRKIIKKNLPS